MPSILMCKCRICTSFCVRHSSVFLHIGLDHVRIEVFSAFSTVFLVKLVKYMQNAQRCLKNQTSNLGQNEVCWCLEMNRRTENRPFRARARSLTLPSTIVCYFLVTLDMSHIELVFSCNSELHRMWAHKLCDVS